MMANAGPDPPRLYDLQPAHRATHKGNNAGMPGSGPAATSSRKHNRLTQISTG